MVNAVVNYMLDGAQVLILAVAIYYVLVLLRGTRAMHSLIGLSIVVSVLVVVSVFRMAELRWLLTMLLPALPFIIVVIFQPEIRRAFAGIGEHTASAKSAAQTTVAAVVKAVGYMAGRKIGALIAFERSVSLKLYQQHGTELEAPVVSELLNTLFFPQSPMHDGGVIIRGGVIAAAGCVFPLATGEYERRTYGMRHRAAIGLSEESDAVVVIVSEERGTISVAYRGTLTQDIDVNDVRDILWQTLGVESPMAVAGESPEKAQRIDGVMEAIAAAKDDIK